VRENARVTADAPPRIRPGLVWAIFLMQVFGFVTFAAIQALRAVPWLPVNAAFEGQFGRLTPLDWVVQWIVAILGILAGTLLFLLRRSALWVYLVSTIAGAANGVRLMVTRGWAEPLTELGTIGQITLVVALALSLLVSVAVLAYVVALYRRGVLS